ncbi:MAG: apolipoprotein N-acyltransferase [Ignavibacteriales bacterium]|nr:apolipoprotein N-acyltransferase [Ignavibacteriales bacterium]
MKIFKRQLLTLHKKAERKKRLLYGLISGVLLGISFPPNPLPYFLFIALVPYLFILEKRDSLAEINRFTYYTAFFFCLISLYWVGSWTTEADPFLMISGVLLVFFNPILFLIPSTLYYFTKKLLGKDIALFTLPLFWVTYEFAYTITDFRFPWLTLGNGLSYFKTYIQIADKIGVYGISILILYVNVLLYKGIKHYFETKKIPILTSLIVILLIIIPLIYGIIKISNYTDSTDKIKVGLIQPNFNPVKRFEIGTAQDQLNIYFELSERAIAQGAEIVVWPETAVPIYLLSGGYDYEVQLIHQFIDSNNVFLLTGMPDILYLDEREEIPIGAKTMSDGTFYTTHNSILLFTPHSKEVQRYQKMLLVPFGEHVPLVEYIPFLGDLIKWNVGISSWNVGKNIVNFKLDIKNKSDVDKLNKIGKDNIKINAVVCIESIYPDFIAQFIQKGADFIAIVTNDSWYSNSSGPYQHKEFATLRAIENHRYVVRCALGGISCIINPLGEVLADTKMFTRDVLVGEVGLETELTFYTENPLLIPILVSIYSVWIIGMFFIIKIKNKFAKN